MFIFYVFDKTKVIGVKLQYLNDIALVSIEIR